MFTANEQGRPLVGIHRTVKLTDSLIAACAIEHGLPVITQDADFDPMAQAHRPLEVHRV